MSEPETLRDMNPPAKYPVDAETIREIANRFTYHQPRDDQPRRYELLRSLSQQLANTLIAMCPPSRERSLALTKLEESVMWANASIARNESGE